MTIENSNLYSEGYSVLKTFLNTYCVDPRHRYKKNWIHASIPDVNSKGFDGYPFIVIEIDVSEDNLSFDRGSEKFFRSTISVYSTEPTDVDSISDAIYSNKNNVSDFKIIKLNASPFRAMTDLHGQKVLARTINMTGRMRL